MDHIHIFFFKITFGHIFQIFKGVWDSMLISQQFAPCLPIITPRAHAQQGVM